MAQIRNKFDIRNSILEEEIGSKKLPNFFDTKDEPKPLECFAMSLGIHAILIILFIMLASIQKTIFPHLPKPEIKQDIEFKLVQNESKPPINKKTKIRSDRDSQAGGKHDPNRAISQPTPKPAPSIKKNASMPVKQKTTVQPKKTIQQPSKNIFKQITQPKQQAPTPKAAVKPQVKQSAPIVSKPTPMKAPGAVVPNVKPTIKPSVAPPSIPKVASAPNSPFKVAVPPSKAPVGTTYRPQTSGTNSGGYSGGSTSPNGGLSPKFSTQKGGYSSTGGSRPTSTPSYASRGASGGSYGNPSPGNPNGTPGIDAIRQPNWGPYMRNLEQRIKRNWSPPKGDTSKRVVIMFTIGRDGRLLSHRITKSSGVPLADRAAMYAIEATAPFSPLPPEFKGQSVPIEFTFDYNVLNSVLR